jgi:hypothetical protein
MLSNLHLFENHKKDISLPGIPVFRKIIGEEKKILETKLAHKPINSRREIDIYNEYG